MKFFMTLGLSILLVSTFNRSVEASPSNHQVLDAEIEDYKEACIDRGLIACGSLIQEEYDSNTEYFYALKTYYQQDCRKKDKANGCFMAAMIATIEAGSEEESDKLLKVKELKVKELFKKSCNNNMMMSCVMLAGYELELGDHLKAKELLKKACNNNMMTSCIMLAGYEFELGDRLKAKELLKKACNNGYELACLTLEDNF